MTDKIKAQKENKFMLFIKEFYLFIWFFIVNLILFIWFYFYNWIYQAYEKKLKEEIEERITTINQAKNFVKKYEWLRINVLKPDKIKTMDLVLNNFLKFVWPADKINISDKTIFLEKVFINLNDADKQKIDRFIYFLLSNNIRNTIQNYPSFSNKKFTIVIKY